MRIFLSALSFSLTVAVPASGFPHDQETLRERAAVAHDTLNVALGYDAISPSLAVLVREADLIVYGRVLAKQSYLSDDGMLIYSDYSVELLRVFAGSLPAAPRALPQGRIVVTHLGGELMLEGKRVTVTYKLLPGLPVKSEVLLLLKRRRGGKYLIVRSSFGAFAVDGGIVRALPKRKGLHHEFDGRDVSDFERAIHSWIH